MIWWIIGFIIADLVIGLCVAAVIDESTCNEYESREYIAIIVFWPLLAVSIGAIGLIGMVAKTYLKYKEELEDEDENSD